MLRKFWPILLACYLWSWPVVVIKVLIDQDRGGFDTPTINAYRYAAAAVAVVALSLFFHRQEFYWCLRRWYRFLPAAALLALFQTVWVYGQESTWPAMTILVGNTSPLWSVAIAAVFFPEERAVLRQPGLVLGLFLAFFALGGLVLTRLGSPVPGYLGGLFLIALAALIWAAYGAVVKVTAVDRSPLPAFSVVVALATGMLMAFGLKVGRMSYLAEAPGWAVGLLLISGPLFVASTNSLMYESIRRVGVGLTMIVTLVIPVMVIINSYLVLRDPDAADWKLWLCGTGLVYGLLLVMRARMQVTPGQATAEAGKPPLGRPAT